MKKKVAIGVILSFGAMLIFGLVGCGAANPELTRQLVIERAVWADNRPERYTLDMLYFDARSGSQLRTVEVVGDEIIDRTLDCAPLPGSTRGCSLESFRGDGVTMDGLYDLAERSSGRITLLSTDERLGHITYIGFTNDDWMRIELTAAE